MSNVCELTGKTVHFGHQVSHSERKTNKKFKPNLFTLFLMSDILNNRFRLKISANALRTLNKKGNLDLMLLDAKDSDLSLSAKRIKRNLLDRIAQ